MSAAPVGVVTQDTAGNWYCDGELCICSLGGHEGMARARSLSRQVSALLQSLRPADRELVIERARAGFNTIDELMPWPFPVCGSPLPD